MSRLSDFSIDSRIVPGHGPDGSPIFSLLAKASFCLVPGERLEYEFDDPVALTENDADVEMDMVAWKPMVDVIVVGKAHAPRGKRAKFFDAGVMVGGRMVQVRVFGKRTIDLSGGSIRFTDPEAFESMPLGHEYAYGGIDVISDPGTAHAYPPNPFGKGYRMFAGPEGLHGMELPNLEDPGQILTPESFVVGSPDRWNRQPYPRYLDCAPRASHPRCERAGLSPGDAMDAKLAYQKSLAASPSVGAGGKEPPPPPKRMDARFHNCAHESMQVPYLDGTESVKLAYMDPDHPILEFGLPGVRPEGWLDVGEGPINMAMVLQTVEIRPENRLVNLVWRGSCAWSGGPDAGITTFEHGLMLD